MKIKTLTISTLTVLTMIGCAINPQNTTMQQDQFINAAKSSLASNNPNQAIAQANQALAINSNNSQAYAIQAAAYQQLNEYDKADQSFKKSLSIESNNTLYRTSYANFLCNSGSYNDATEQYQLAENTETSKPIQSSDKLAQIYSSAGDCYSKQNQLDSAIENYESSINTKNAPQSAYIGVTKAYIAQNNYPKASLYISSYPGNEDTVEVLKLKIKSLTGLLNSNYQISDNNRKLLKTKINDLNQKLVDMQRNNTSSVASSDEDKSVVHATLNSQSDNSVPTNTANLTNSSMSNDHSMAITTATAQKPTTPVANAVAKKPAVTNNSDNGASYTANKSALSNRIKKASNGHRYVVVEHGDTLFNISQRSGVSQSKISEINHLKNEYVPLGTRLYLD